MSLKQFKLHITRFLSFTQQLFFRMKGEQIFPAICYNRGRDNQSFIS